MRENQPRSRLQFLHNPWIVYALMVMVVLSLLLHLATWLAINRLRGIAKAQVSELATQVEQAEREIISMNLRLDQSVPIQASIPIDQQLSIPISTTVALSDTVEIPLETPIGDIQIPVPITVDVPIDMMVPVSVKETVDVSTTIDLDLEVPITIPVAETSFADYLTDLRRELIELGEDL